MNIRVLERELIGNKLSFLNDSCSQFTPESTIAILIIFIILLDLKVHGTTNSQVFCSYIKELALAISDITVFVTSRSIVSAVFAITVQSYIVVIFFADRLFKLNFYNFHWKHPPFLMVNHTIQSALTRKIHFG